MTMALCRERSLYQITHLYTGLTGLNLGRGNQNLSCILTRFSHFFSPFPAIAGDFQAVVFKLEYQIVVELDNFMINWLVMWYKSGSLVGQFIVEV